MSAIDFVIRTRTGAVERGSVGGDGQGFLLDAGSGGDISLNLGQSDLRGYDRAGSDLLITLADGRVIVLENYFTGDTARQTNGRLFISANGELNEVGFVEGDGGALFAQYGPTETWGKWSPSDELIFVNDPEVSPQYAEAYDGEGEEATMLAAALPLLGVGGAGAAMAGAGALLGVPLLFPGGGGGGNGGGGNGGDNWVAPTVNDADSSSDISGNDPAEVIITGTANPGSEVEVTIDGTTITVIADENSDWEVVFTGDDFPSDGTYEDVEVVVTDPDGTVTELDGPSFVIDTTPPVIEIDTGTVSVDYIVNGDDQADGVTVSGTGEPGAVLEATVGMTTQTTTIGEDGTWSFEFDPAVFGEGEYIETLTITATDSFGNTTTVLDAVQVDTVNTVALTNGPLTGDDLISQSEWSNGVEFTGTSQPDSEVVVTVEGVSKSVTTDANGVWTVTFDSTELSDGTYSTQAVIVSTDPAGNISTITHNFDVDTEQAVTISTSGVAVDGIVNASEYQGNVTVTGTGEAGSTVTVTSGLNDLGTTTVASDGTWSLTFHPSLIDGAPGHSELGYTGTLQATASDAAGNTSTASGAVTVDTNTSAFAFFDDADQVINAAERAAGVDLDGSAEPGATVSVTISGTTMTTVADANGAWTVAVPTSLIPSGVDTLSAAVTATDLAGNSTSFTSTIAVDTQAGVTVNTSTVTGDGVVNAAERAAGVLLTGTTDAASDTVTVMVNGNSYAATVAADKTWSVTLPTTEIPTGNAASLAVQVTSVDTAGNTATATGTIAVDTVTNVAVVTNTVEGDGVINAAEHVDGVTLNGTAESGASVQVTLGTVTRTVTADGSGNWSANWTTAEIPTGQRTLAVTAIATDAAGNTATASGTVDVDTFVENFNFSNGSAIGGPDGIINAAEAASGLTITGTTEVGGTVTLSLAGQSVNAIVAPDGTWTATFSGAQLPQGDDTTYVLTAVSTDPAGNSDTITQNVRIDTDAGTLAISAAPVEGDDVVNKVEASDGVTIVGTSDAGRWVTVTLAGVSKTVLTDSNGNWTANYAANEVAPGTYTAEITATITDSAGNTLLRTDSVRVDTEVLNFATSTNPVEGDNVINKVEASDGFYLTGTTEPGGTVSVSFNGATRNATVDNNGNWTVYFEPATIPDTEQDFIATIDTTDAVGNTAQTTVPLRVDTYVNLLTMDGGIAGDDVINAAEAAQGVTLTGDVEDGSSVIVTIGGVDHVATVTNGAWTVDIPSSSLPSGTGTMPVVVTAEDSAGNIDSMTTMVAYDTEAPDTLSWKGYGRDNAGIDEVRTDITPDALYLGEVEINGSIVTVEDADVGTITPVGPLNTTYISLDTHVTDGTTLVLASTDAAGNTSGAYLVTDDPNTSTVPMSDAIANALTEFNIDTIDLHFAEDSHLTITEAQIQALSSTSDTVAILGGSDDSVTITGASFQSHTVEDGVGYNVYSLGDATLYIDDDITKVNGVI